MAADESTTPTEHLVMDLLIARWRLGEEVWTFPSSLRPTLRRLAERGWLGHKSGVAEATELAWPTDTGLLAWMGDNYLDGGFDYEAPLAKAVQWYCGFGSRELLRRFAEAKRAHEAATLTASREATDGR